MSVAGTWNITMNTPMGAQKGTLNIAVKGTELTGTMSGPQGAITLKEGKAEADGKKASWKADLTQPMPITLEFAANVDGNNISGNVKLGGFGNASFSGTRA
jgi:hypothetical protein